MKAKNAEGLSVGRVLISGKNIRRKIRDLSAGPAINGLQPQVLDTVFFHSIHHSLPIRSEFRVVRYSRISIEKAAGRFSTLLTETHQRNLGPVVVQVRKVEGQQFAIARNRKPIGVQAVGHNRSGDNLRCSPFQSAAARLAGALYGSGSTPIFRRGSSSHHQPASHE
jgi:hypothetical protein